MSNCGNFSLIVPAAGDNVENGLIPKVFTPDREGIMWCVKSIMGLNYQDFDNIYFAILNKHVELFDIDKLMQLQFKRLGLKNSKIVILDNPTNTQSETIAMTIEKENISGSVFIKDADSFFEAEVTPENNVAVYPLENLNLVDPQHKSYVAVDDMQHVTNIIEKKIVSNLFNAGGYGFENSNDFLESYYKYNKLGKIYISHLIYAMLLSGNIFYPIKVKNYADLNL